MSKTQKWSQHWWLGLFPILLVIMCVEKGLAEGIREFSWFLYILSMMLMVAHLVGSLIAWLAPTKPTLLITASIVIAYAVFQIFSGDIEILRRGAIFGGIVGTALGVMIGIFSWFASPRCAAKLASWESSLYGRIRAWVYRKKP